MPIDSITTVSVAEKMNLERSGVRFQQHMDGTLDADFPKGTECLGPYYVLFDQDLHQLDLEVYTRTTYIRLPDARACVLLEAVQRTSDGLASRSGLFEVEGRSYLLDTPDVLDQQLLQLGGCTFKHLDDGFYGMVIVTLPADVKITLLPSDDALNTRVQNIKTAVLLSNRLEILLWEEIYPDEARPVQGRSVHIPPYEQCHFSEALQDSQHWLLLYQEARVAFKTLLEQSRH